MPTVPWKALTDIQLETSYVVMASRLPLRHFWDTSKFLALTLQVRRQLQDADGLVGYTLHAQPMRKTYWTLSAWSDSQALHSFAASDHHRTVIAALHGRLNPTTFDTWSVNGDDLPISWNAVFARLNSTPVPDRPQSSTP